MCDLFIITKYCYGIILLFKPNKCLQHCINHLTEHHRQTNNMRGIDFFYFTFLGTSFRDYCDRFFKLLDINSNI